MLSQLIKEAVKARADMELAPSDAILDLEAVVRQSNTDVVITGLVNDELPTNCKDLMRMWNLQVVGVAERTGRAVLYRQRVDAIDLGDLAPDDLLTAARADATRAPRSH